MPLARWRFTAQPPGGFSYTSGSSRPSESCAPAFFASLVFIRSFARAGFGGEAIGSNLFGALVGGLLESLSYWLGIEALLLIAGGLYAASLIALPFVSRQAIRLSIGTPDVD